MLFISPDFLGSCIYTAPLHWQLMFLLDNSMDPCLPDVHMSWYTHFIVTYAPTPSYMYIMPLLHNILLCGLYSYVEGSHSYAHSQPFFILRKYDIAPSDSAENRVLSGALCFPPARFFSHDSFSLHSASNALMPTHFLQNAQNIVVRDSYFVDNSQTIHNNKTTGNGKSLAGNNS